MRIGHTRTVAATAAVAAAGLAALSLRPTPHPTATLAARNPAVEVRTEVIRRTIHVSGRRHLRSAQVGAPPRAHGGPSHGGAPAAHTRSSAGHHAPATTSAGTTVATRTSPGHGAAGTSAGTTSPASHPVTTRTSPGHSAAGTSAGTTSPASHPVTTRTSPGHASGGGSGSGSSGAPVTTRSSGSHHGDDGGEGHDD
jgi:hypothetical protein